mgnify:CR=1 FL=1
MRHQKIIHLILGRADPNSLNGVNVVVHNIATVQQKQGCDVEVWGITKNINLADHELIYPLYLFKPMSFRFSKNNKLIDKILENEKKGIWLEKLIEIWSIQLNGIDYEVHVDATKERKIEQR